VVRGFIFPSTDNTSKSELNCGPEISRIWKEYQLEPRTRFETPVTSVKRVESEDGSHKWRINDGEEEPFDAVIVTIGTCGKPKWIHLDGMPKDVGGSKGVLHCVRYRSAGFSEAHMFRLGQLGGNQGGQFGRNKRQRCVQEADYPLVAARFRRGFGGND
jgi:thioredoxin reductase